MTVTPTRQRPQRFDVRRALRRSVSGNRGDVIFRGIALAFTLSILVLAVLLVYEMWNASQLSMNEFGFWGFFTSTDWNPVSRQFGSLHVIVGTLVTSVIAVILAVPIAVGIALFITELAPPWARGPVAFLVDILAAIPSIVYGLWAFFVLVPVMREYINPLLITLFGWTGFVSGPQFGLGVLTAGVVLAIMIIPIISAVAREVISQVPREQPEAMLALGATRWETVWQVILPYARTGIVGAVVLGLARAIGETMAVTMVIGNRTEIVDDLLALNATAASLIANEFREAGFRLHVSALVHVAFNLMIVSLIVNILARALVWTSARRLAGAR